MSNTLHELLLFEKEIISNANYAYKLVENSLRKKSDFEGIQKKYTPAEGHEQNPEQDITKEIGSTVVKTLSLFQGKYVPLLDTILSKEMTNSMGKACANVEVVVENKKINLGTLSATALLAFERYLKAVKKIYSSLPTLPKDKSWERNGDKNVTKPIIEYKKRMLPEVIVKIAPDEHTQGDSEIVEKETLVGQFDIIYESGGIPLDVKLELLDRIEAFIRVVKKARNKANAAPVEEITIGQQFFDTLHEGLL